MEETLQTFQRLTAFLLENEQQQPVPAPIEPDDLLRTLDLSLADEAVPDQELEARLRELIQHTPKTASRLFFNQLFGGRNSQAVLGDLLAVMLNNSMYTYKVAGPMIGVEKTLLAEVSRRIGYGADAGGTIAAGGSMTNFMAMNMARDIARPQARQEGMTAGLVAYTSAEAHYSIPKNAAFLGIGRQNVRSVPTNARGEMQPDALAAMIEEDLRLGNQPFFVNATAGTTVFGAFDPIAPLAAICRKHRVWLHVDGAYCGAVIFSRRHRHLVSGLERSDSFSFNAHKMIGTPLSCSLLVTQDRKHLHDSYSNDAQYLYQTGSDDWNPGKTSFQCGRRNDALKFWTLWKSVGTQGLEALVDKQFVLADFARTYIADHSDYQLLGIDNSISVCFNYKNIPAQELCTALYEHAEVMVGYGSFNGADFVRLVTINYRNSEDDILNFFGTMERFFEHRAEADPAPPANRAPVLS